MWKKYVITQQKIKVDMFKSFEHYENAIKRKVSLFFNIEYCLKKMKVIVRNFVEFLMENLIIKLLRTIAFVFHRMPLQIETRRRLRLSHLSEVHTLLSYKSCKKRDPIFQTCHMISRDHLYKGLCDFMGRSHSR